MKKTLLEKNAVDFPEALNDWIAGANLYGSSCSAQAKVYFIDKGQGYFLKCSDRGMLKKEAVMTRYFHTKGLGAEVLSYISNEKDWLLTAAIKGEDCLHEMYKDHPKRLSETLAYELRKLHETSCDDCPIPNRTAEYLADVEHNFETNNYDASYFPDNFGYSSPQAAYSVFSEGKPRFRNDVLLHGDYCLPNILLNNWKRSGFVDVGKGGVGDRHIDIFWGVWTLWFNLKTHAYRDRFLDAYGRDKVDESMLKVVAAAEVFL